MSDYKCTMPYFSHSMTKRYGYGNLISSGVYSQLPPSEQVNFTRVIAKSNDSYGNSSRTDSSWMPSQDISSSWDVGGDSNSSSSDSSSFDFGGGDSGGGGASGDW